MADLAAPLFPNYLQLRERARLSPRLWAWARALGVGVALAYVVLLLVSPHDGLVLLWQLTVPLLPALFLVAPGVWRNVCPLAAANQTPRLLGLSRALSPPHWFTEYGFLLGVAGFFGFASTRKWLFNSSGLASALLLLAALSLAFLGGLVFKGKSGWCSSICPLYPVQRLYNQTPFATVPNAHCTPCVGCTKNCYDFNPGVAYLADLYDDDRYYAGYRTFFAAAMPGFVVAYFTLSSPASVTGGLRLYLDFGIALAVSVGVFGAAERFLKVSTNKLTALSGASAFVLFYYYGLPIWLGAVWNLWGGAPPAFVRWLVWGAVVALALVWVARTYRKEPLFVGQLLETGETRISAGATRVLRRAAAEDKPEVTFVPEDLCVLAEEGRTLLELAEANGQKIEAGCRMGVCGADPVVILDGMENLAAVGGAERGTLERLGLGANCRLACMSRVRGPVTVSLDLSLAQAAGAVAPTFDVDESVRRVVVIGNGIAGVTAADHVRRNHPDCEIDLVGRERHPLYNRMAITRLIYGRSAMSGLYLQPDEWYESRNITCWLNTNAAAIDPEERQVRLATGEALGFDRLILATGSSSFVPEIPGFGLPGTFTLREAEEAMEVRAFVQRHGCRKAVVGGGGLLGLEAAYALHKSGLDVVVLERGEWLLRRQLDARGAHFLEQYLEAMGLTIVTNAETDSLLGADRIAEVVLKDARTLPCDVFLVAVGIAPNVQLAVDAGLAVGRAVVVDGAMRTSVPEILAAGDVCEVAGQVPGLWAVAVEQARVAATNAVGGAETYEPIVPVTALKVVGVDVTSIGRFEAASPDELELVSEDLDGHRYRKLVVADGKLVGAILIGHPQEAAAVIEAVRSGRDVSGSIDALRVGDWEALAAFGSATVSD